MGLAVGLATAPASSAATQAAWQPPWTARPGPGGPGWPPWGGPWGPGPAHPGPGARASRPRSRAARDVPRARGPDTTAHRASGFPTVDGHAAAGSGDGRAARPGSRARRRQRPEHGFGEHHVHGLDDVAAVDRGRSCGRRTGIGGPAAHAPDRGRRAGDTSVRRGPRGGGPPYG